ncbi:hypothetical protein BFL36_01460 [Clavibacter michiganensis]|uniref:Uncharacterized protein n=1 Tax=Clavibacter michiganensis TaxID=28447 RepID=A0A251YVW1_9MICO|nr:hypothetical protein [Clavibacter michiganensis]OUE28387.1 hypothetical protein BFL36_01460 [Clavibacter michiganensis]
MKHITYAEKSLLMGDDAADALLEYAAALATHGRGDSVTLRALSSDGDEVDATFLLTAGSPLMAETATTTLPEPDNAGPVAAMLAAVARMERPEPVSAADDADGLPDLDRYLLE